ncbi:hypothetical protein D3C75_194490 [compost metagenome]
MYHLRDKIYVEIESRISRKRIPYACISPRVGFEYHPAEYEETSEQIGYTVSLDELDTEQFKELFTKLFAQDDKAFLYVDGKTYLRLYAMLVKAIMPSVTLDVFRWVLLCKKATFQVSLLNMHKPTTNILEEVTINEAVVKELFAFEDPHQEVFGELLTEDSDALSLEWRIMRLFTQDRVGRLPRTLRNILRRIALANGYDALDVWGRQIANPEAWDFAGADMNTLLNGQSVFEGTLNFHYLNSTMFLQPNLFDNKPTDQWIKGLLLELITVLDHCDEAPTAGRTRLVYQLLTSEEDLLDPEVLKLRVLTMFKGAKRLALPNADSGKYDENLVRFILSTDPELLKDCVKGATW